MEKRARQKEKEREGDMERERVSESDLYLSPSLSEAARIAATGADSDDLAYQMQPIRRKL